MADNHVSPPEGGEAAFFRQQLELVTAKYFRIFATAFALYYIARGIGYWLGLHPETGRMLAGLAWVSSFGALVAVWAQLSGRLRHRHVVLIMVVLGNMVTVNAFVNMALTGGQAQFVQATYAMMVFGLLALTFRMWLSLIVPCLVCFVAGAVLLDVPKDFQLAGMLTSGIALSAIAYMIRVPVLHSHFTLEAKLVDEAEKLKAASREKDRFLANMTHELRTPMTGVLGMLDLVAETELSKDQQELVRAAQSSAGYLLAVINDILDFSKLEAGKIVIRPEPVNLGTLSADMVNLFRGQAQAKNIDLIFEGPTTEIIGLADPIRVGQVLMNLVSNAVKYTEKGSVRVSLGLSSEGPEILVWRIRDTGAGIPQNRIATLFERFERLDNSVTRSQQGTGLGLAIIRELVSLMQGDVQVESQVGHGSVFSFTMPFVPAEKPIARPQETAREERAPASFDGPLRILVAEDNPVNQMLIGRLLDRPDWQLSFVGNGESAVAAASKSTPPFDLVLMDVQMPVMDGVTAAGIIRDKMQCPPPIIALTANTMPADIEAYKQSGMVACVGKPISKQDLYAAIASALEDTGTGQGHGFA